MGGKTYKTSAKFLVVLLLCVCHALWWPNFTGLLQASSDACLPDSLVAGESTWRYLVTATAAPENWMQPSFDDSGWEQGPAQLGYGDDDEVTVIGSGPDPNNKYPTTYFRTTFTVDDPSQYKGLILQLLRDDGARLFLNGVEAVRSNLPDGAIDYTAHAVDGVTGADETTFFEYALSSQSLAAGSNLLAVEVHQVNAVSNDLSFDLRLLGERKSCPSATPTPIGCDVPQPASVRFAVIGDYGQNTRPEREVATMIKSWNPDFIVTVGDNSYPDASTLALLDQNVGQYFWEYIYPYAGNYTTSIGGPIQPATFNRFWPAVGNHDWDGTTDVSAYLNYFTLPGNERYYNKRFGPVELFMLDSDVREPDGNRRTSVQANWLKTQLAASSAAWKVVVFHHPAYSSGLQNVAVPMQWPFKAWGAQVALSGHEHDYERLEIDGFPYLINGAGGGGLRTILTPTVGSLVRYDDDYGAQQVEANDRGITFKFFNRNQALIDSFTLGCAPSPAIDPTQTPTPRPTTTQVPTETPTPAPTATPISTSTPLPTATNQPPTATPIPTVKPSPTPLPTNQPSPTATSSIPPALTILNGSNQGAPGSSFIIAGLGFPANKLITLSVNGNKLISLMTDEDGAFQVALLTPSLTPLGVYVVRSDGGSPPIAFILDQSAPIHPMPEKIKSIAILPGVTSVVYLPMVQRR